MMFWDGSWPSLFCTKRNSMKIYEDVKNIKGIGEKTGALLNKLGVYSVEDLLHFFPRTYIQYSDPVKLKNAKVGETGAFYLFIENDFNFRKTPRMNIGTGLASDGENAANIVFFNAPYLKNRLLKGRSFVFYGKLVFENNRYKLEHPLIFTLDEYHSLQSSLQPVYPLTRGLSNKLVQKSVKAAIEEAQYPYLYEEYLPGNLVNEYSLCPVKDAIKGMHFPGDISEMKTARRRLAFDEIFLFIYLMKSMSEDAKEEISDYKYMDTAYPDRLIEALPYRLTNAQLKVFNEIRNDLTSGFVMNRLVQGDVGSGKTIVAFLALLLCVDNGYQGALMAPTELLASQHFDNVTKLIKDFGLPFKPVLLTGSVKAKDKKIIYEKIANNEYNLVIGTHALFQEKVVFKNLSLVVTDEQHRFGVKQRLSLNEKGQKPHVLVMSATPIPRTLAIVLYGDMHLSVLDEKPSSRLPIKNCVVDTSYRPKAYEFIVKQVREGRQVYIICPMVEESEGLENVENVIDYTKKIKNLLPSDIRIEMIHGQMKADAKKYIMDEFALRNIDVLVSTTVIEVGIDVPNATVMMVENAERFGLSQLHQLRGRIGRGEHQSYAIFINSSDNSHNKRLEILNKSNDGFYVASEDLKLRGAGDLFGIRQSGDLMFEIADVYEDADLMLQINESLTKLLKDDPELSKEENISLKAYLDENKNKFIDFGSI